MIARLTFISVPSADAEDLRRIYNDEIVPVIKRQKGNIGAWLLEPTDEKDDFISLTEWVSRSSAEAYEASGTYKILVDKVRSIFTANINPVLKTYIAQESKIIQSA